jgi:chemotaxis protein histidine kinase CheA
MPNEELLRELLGVFGDEAEERLDAADALLLEIERSDEARPEAFAKLLREMHTLKGSAAAVSLDDVSTVSHDLETFFTRIRDGEIPCEPASLDVGYNALREMRTMIRAAITGGESGVDVADLRERLASTTPEGPATADAPASGAPSPPVAAAGPAPDPSRAGSPPRSQTVRRRKRRPQRPTTTPQRPPRTQARARPCAWRPPSWTASWRRWVSC